MEITRRNAIAATATAAAAVAASVATVASADEAAAPAAQQQADVVVVGAGMGGLTAGVRALENGIANVTVVEISRWVGGGSAYSVGTMHPSQTTGTTAETFDAATGYQNQTDLAHKEFLAIPEMFEWVRGLGLPLAVKGIDPVPTEGFEGMLTAMSGDTPRSWMCNEEGTPGVPSGAANFFVKYGELFESMGGNLLTQTGATEILTDELGHITGVKCRTRSGEELVIATTQVILACGGWQNDEEMRLRHWGKQAVQAQVMGTPYNTAAGIKLAAKFGASMAGDFSRFSGLWYPALPAKNFCQDIASYEDEANGPFSHEVGGKLFLFDALLESIPASGIIVNNRGMRYVDESDNKDTFSANILDTDRGSFIMVCDGPAFDAWLEGNTFSETATTVADKLAIVTSPEVGGVIYAADTLEELADAMNGSGIANHRIAKGNLVKTVAQYNEAVEAGTLDALDVPRSSTSVAKIENGPFYAMPLTKAIYVNFGGLAVDDNAQVLDCSMQPIAGLYACAPCAGGFFRELYTGSIAAAAVTGRWAADKIAVDLGVKAAV